MITAGGSTEQNGLGSGTTTQSFTFDIGTRTNGLLTVVVFTVTATVRTPSSLTWNGVSMDFVSTENQAVTGIWHTVTIGWLANPTNGSNTFQYITSSSISASSETVSIMPSWWDGAHQTQASVKDQHATGSGSTDPSIGAITPSEDNELVLAGYVSEANSPLTIGGWGTELQNYDAGPRVMGNGYVIQTTASAVTAEWAGPNDNWTGLIASFKQAAGVGGATPHGPLGLPLHGPLGRVFG